MDDSTSIEDLGPIGEQDWLLRELIEVYAMNGFEIGITLNVGGFLVTGLLTSPANYFRALAGNIKHANWGQFDEIKLGLVDVLTIYEDKFKKPVDADENWSAGTIQYIHLKNAHITAPGQAFIPKGEGMVWRGKLSSIDGFFVGLIEPQQLPSDEGE